MIVSSTQKPGTSPTRKDNLKVANYYIFLLTGLLLMLATGVSAQTIYYVNKATGNDAAAGTSWSSAFRNVTRAVTAANASTAAVVSIWVAGGTYTSVDGIAVLPADHSDTSFNFYRGNGIGKSLKVYGGFRGNETTVSGRDTSHKTYLDGVVGSTNSYHIIVVSGLATTADSVVIDGFTIQNGMATGRGSKLYNGISVTRNGGGGMAIVHDGSAKLAVSNCKITSNEAQGVDSTCVSPIGGNGFGGGVYLVGAPAYFSNCMFFGNEALGNNGGCTTAGWMLGGFGGSGVGGGMFVDSSATVIEKCVFKSNVAMGGDAIATSGIYRGGPGIGGGIYISNCSPSILIDSFIDNLASAGLSPSGGGGGGDCYGGGMYNDYANPHIAHCSFNSNFVAAQNPSIVAVGFYGGGIYNTHSNPVIDTCDFLYNRATNVGASFGYYAYGAGIYNDFSNPVITYCDLAYNQCVMGSGGGNPYGAGIYNYNSSPVINTTSISYNQGGFTTSGTGYAGSGGGMFNTSFSNPIITNSDINNNTSETGGAGMYNEHHSAPVLVNCNINDNQAGNEGGGFVNDSSILDLYNCSINNNSANYSGGGILNQNSYSRTVNCLFQSNFSSQGGGICNYQSYSKIDSSSFERNIAYDRGGAIYQEDSVLDPMHSMFYNNVTGRFYSSRGGAIYLKQNSTTTAFKSEANFYVRNLAYGGGGAICLELGTTGNDTMTNNVFITNKSFDSSIIANGGGAMLLTGSKHLLYNNTFFKDSSLLRGGAICFSGTGVNARVANNIFYNNSSVGPSTDTGYLGTGTFVFTNNSYSTTNPQFRNSALPAGPNNIWGDADDGLELQPCSPSRNAGSSLFVLPYEVLDIAGATRIEGASIDMGAYETNPLGIISGGSVFCVGSTSALTDTSAGGTWSSSNTAVATVASTGVVTGVAGGTAIITYTKTYSCGPSSDTMLVNVQRTASMIGGTIVICRGTTTTLTDSVSGGVWTSGNTSVATIGSTGVVTGVAAGPSIISYAVSNACGLSSATRTLTVQRGVSAISGRDTVCAGGTSVLADSVTGGSWTSGTVSVATITGGGSVAGISAGTSTITYSLTNACGTTSATTIFHVEQAAAPITGPDSVCVSSSLSLADATPNGTWTSGTGAAATVSAGGTVTGVSAGTTVITYAVSNTCGTSSSMLTIKVEAAVAAITGNDTVCEGHTITLADVSAGGAWSVSNTALASVSGGVVSGISAGAPIISYTLINSCGTTNATHNITVLSAYDCATIAGVAGGNAGAGIEVFPNPATQVVRIAAQIPGNVSLSSITGKMLMQQNNARQMNISDLPAGIYLLTIYDQQGVRLKEVKLVKE